MTAQQTTLNRQSRRSKATLLLVAASIAFGCQARNPAIPGAGGEERIKAGQITVKPKKPTPASAARLVRSDYAEGEVAKLCLEAITRTKTRIDAVKALAADKRTFASTVLELENALGDFSDETNLLTFMGYVSTNEKVSAEGTKCEEEIGQYYSQISTDKALYEILKAQKSDDIQEKRLLEQTLIGFEAKGMNLSDADLAKYKAMDELLVSKTTAFQKNLNADKSQIETTVEELAGVPQTFIDRLTATPDGKKIIRANAADTTVVMENCSVEATRKKMLLAYWNRGTADNTKLLEEAVELRRSMAQMLRVNQEDKSWVAYRTVNRMAKNRETVEKFLSGLEGKLSQRAKQDLAQLLAYKKELDPAATVVNQWDQQYLTNQLKKRDFSVDDEKIREYFPVDVVMAGVFSVYSEMLGVKYTEVKNADVWAPDVKLYEIRDKADDRLIGYFYADLFPRQGKYNHAAAFQLISGRMVPGQDYYSLPVSSIVANMAPPSEGRPSLLSHDEVETVFHEFGHIMHQTLTRAPFASLSGSNTAQDFVEAPSQMLENWVWRSDVLAKLSGHFETKQPLPQELLQKMLAAKDFQQGMVNMRQLVFGTFDVAIHKAQGPVDVTATFNEIFERMLGLKPIDGGHFPGTFGHMMGGYDAGYYGYLWSKVYAQDMFSIFESKGVNAPEVGMSYRREILETGNMREAMSSLIEFLGREPKNDAFYKDLKI